MNNQTEQNGGWYLIAAFVVSALWFAWYNSRAGSPLQAETVFYGGCCALPIMIGLIFLGFSVERSPKEVQKPTPIAPKYKPSFVPVIQRGSNELQEPLKSWFGAFSGKDIDAIVMLINKKFSGKKGKYSWVTTNPDTSTQPVEKSGITISAKRSNNSILLIVSGNGYNTTVSFSPSSHLMNVESSDTGEYQTVLTIDGLMIQIHMDGYIPRFSNRPEYPVHFTEVTTFNFY